MPISAINTTPQNNPPQNRRNFFSGKIGIIIVFTILILFAGFMAYLTTKKQFNVPDVLDSFGLDTIGLDTNVEPEEIVNTETHSVTDEFIENIDKVTLEDVKEASNSTGINPLSAPALSDTETSARIYEKIGNTDPESHNITYNDIGLSLSSLEIKQGDYVTWTNTSSGPMMVVGEGWKSVVPRDPQDFFTYTFLIKGEYKYKVNDKVEGMITVVSP